MRGERVTAFACVMGDVDLVRPLGLAGIPCAVVARPGAPTRYSRFTRQILPWADAWEQPERLVTTLLEFASRQPERPVLFYEEDRELLLVSRYRERLAEAFRFVVADPVLVEDLVDKSRFQELARRTGLPVPLAHRLDPVDGPTPDDVELRFPLVIKPLTRRTDVWEPLAGSAKALRVDHPRELAVLWRRLERAKMVVLAQQLVEGSERAIESYHVYIDEGGEVVGEFTGRKIRTYPVSFGHSTALEITDAPDVARLGASLAARLGLRGVAKFDFKRASDGTLYLLEINPRFNLWHHPGAVAGVNLPALVFGDLTGRPRPARVRSRAGVRWCKLWRDVAAARDSGVSLRHWLPWALRCEAKRALALDDPLPLIGAALASLVPTRAAHTDSRSSNSLAPVPRIPAPHLERGSL